MSSKKSTSPLAWIGVGLMLLVSTISCDGPSTTDQDQLSADLRACGLDDGSIERGAHLHACNPNDQKKTTICHIPPGNPANAHTICVGNAAVPAHVANHGDSIGPCLNERPCPKPDAGTPTGAGGSPGDTTGTGGATGTGGGVVVGTGGAGGNIVP